MSTMECKLKHIELIQQVIQRMAGNSFLLKGWSITLVAALFVLSAKDAQTLLLLIALLPILSFWGLDGYFLRQERLYRKLYDKVIVTAPEQIDFSMSTQPFMGDVDDWLRTCCSSTLLAFHAPILGAVLLILCIVLINL
ncbi:MAG: hypothetical protein V6Z89_07185 [Desulfobacter sp.]